MSLSVLMFCAIVRCLYSSFVQHLLTFVSFVCWAPVVSSVPHHVWMVGVGFVALITHSVLPWCLRHSWFVGERVFGLHFSNPVVLDSNATGMLSGLPSRVLKFLCRRLPGGYHFNV